MQVFFVMRMLHGGPVQSRHCCAGCGKLIWMCSGLQDNVEVQPRTVSHKLLTKPAEAVLQLM